MINNKCPKCGAPRENGPECPKCGVIYARAEQSAYHEKLNQQGQQQSFQQKAAPIPAAWINTRAQLKIDCTVCKLAAGMEAKSVPRFPLFIRIIGLIIATPSAVGMLVGGLMMFKPGGSFGTDSVGFFAGGAFMMLSAVGGLVGWLLLMRKNAFVCKRCGFLLDRA